MPLRRSVNLLCGIVLLSLGLVDAASGAAILTSDGRNLQALAQADDPGVASDGEFDSSVPPAAFAPWVDLIDALAVTPGAQATATASQTSAVTPTLFTGSGAASLLLTVEDPDASAGAQAQSQFLIQFDLLTPHAFVLTGFTADSNASVSVGSFGFSGTSSFSEVGVLEPGSYSFNAAVNTTTLGVQGVGSRDAFGQFGFEFALTELNGPAVPEPGTLSLMIAGIGAAALGLRRQRFRVR